MSKPDVVICLGKSINKDYSLDWILTNRVELAYKLAKKNNVPLLLTGGKSHKKVLEKVAKSEASAMYDYLKKNYPGLKLIVILEEKGESTIHQLCIIKNKILLPKKWYNLVLVTDEIHLKRAVITTEWIFGDKFKVFGQGSLINLNGSLRSLYENREGEKYNLSINGLIKKYKKGDDKGILKFDEKIRSASKEHIISGGDPTVLQEIIND